MCVCLSVITLLCNFLLKDEIHGWGYSFIPIMFLKTAQQKPICKCSTAKRFP